MAAIDIAPLPNAAALSGIRELDQALKAPAKTSRLSSLDGLRAISILLVFVGHLAGTRGFGRPDFHVGDYAHLGVIVFFVISGFLITSLLLSEHDKTGRVSLKLFYARRSLRIFPASYAYLAGVLLLSAAGIAHLQSRDIWHAATYTMNYLPGRSWQVGHLWSLAVEEQFYLIWPFAFAALGRRRAIRAATAVILLAPVARLAGGLFLAGTPYHRLEMFPMMADSLAMGCVLSATRGWLEKKDWYLRLFRPVYSLLLLLSVLLINRYMAYPVVWAIGTSIVNISLAILIHRCVSRPADRVGRVLNSAPVAFVGVLSYSLYLWQQPFLNRYGTAWMTAFPQNLVLAIAAALASYWLLEKPLLGLRHRLRA